MPPVFAPCDELQSLLNHAPQGMACFDAARRLRWANPSFAAAMGCTLVSLQGMTMAELDAHLMPLLAERKGVDGPLAQCLREATTSRAIGLQFLSGGEHTLRGWASPQGGFNLYLTDQTAQQKQEQRHNDFLSVAAHELRNPIASLFGFAQLLRSRKLKPDDMSEVIDILCRQADALSQWVEELLDLARIETQQGQDFKPQAVSLGTLIREAREALPPALKPARIHGRIAPNSDLLWVDRSKTLRALINVLSNALKYSPISTPVEVNAQRCSRSKAMAEIVIVDHGMGMSAEQRSRVFERFYRADPAGPIPGTGLGMSLVQEIVTLLGGSVSVNSALGQGCSVTLRLPLAAPPTTDKAARPEGDGCTGITPNTADQLGKKPSH